MILLYLISCDFHNFTLNCIAAPPIFCIAPPPYLTVLAEKKTVVSLAVCGNPKPSKVEAWLGETEVKVVRMVSQEQHKVRSIFLSS